MTETLTKVGMGALLGAAVPLGGDPSVWAQWGLAGLVVGYTLYRDTQREKGMAEALEKRQAWVQQTLMGALERNTVAMEKIASRPCLREAKG